MNWRRRGHLYGCGDSGGVPNAGDSLLRAWPTNARPNASVLTSGRIQTSRRKSSLVKEVRER